MPATATKPAQNPEGLFSSPEKRTLIACLLLVVATLALYNPVSRHPFVNYDDDRYITNNAHVRAGLTGDSVAWAFTFQEANWHPLTWVSHELDCQLYKLNPAGHHYSSVLLHALNVVLLFLVLQAATGFTWRSLMVAVLFAVHPVNVESVAWVSERKTPLSMLFFLLALGAYTQYARKPGVGRYFAVAFLFACGLMSKPMVITFPFVLLLWDYWPLRRMGAESGGKPATKSFGSLVLEKVPLFVLSAASAVITVKAQAAGGAVRSVGEFPFSERLGNAIVSYGRYVLNTLWPMRLSLVYPHPKNAFAVWPLMLALVLLIAMTVLVMVSKRRRYLPVGWLWFLGTLVPMIGLVQVGAQAMADRYAYLPVLGLFIMACWSAADYAQQRHVPPGWLVAASAVVLLGFAWSAHRQLGYWSDNVTLWSRALQVTTENYIAEDNLGGALMTDYRTEEAIAHFRQAVKINPYDPFGNLNLGAYEQQHGNLQPAVEIYQRVLRATVDGRLRATAFANLGSAYRVLHDYAHAKENYEAALRLVPESPHAWIGLGLVEQKAGDLSRAADDYYHAASIQPTDVTYILLAQALEKSGHANEAKAAYDQAQQLSANLDEARQGASQLLSE